MSKYKGLFYNGEDSKYKGLFYDGPKPNTKLGKMKKKKKMKAMYKYKGGKIDDANYKSCGANIIRTT